MEKSIYFPIIFFTQPEPPFTIRTESRAAVSSQFIRVSSRTQLSSSRKTGGFHVRLRENATAPIRVYNKYALASIRFVLFEIITCHQPAYLQWKQRRECSMPKKP